MIKALEYCDTSATYWNLYGSKAKISDKELVESLLGHTNSLVFLVRGSVHCASPICVQTHDYLIDHAVLFHRCIVYYRNIQDAPPQ